MVVKRFVASLSAAFMAPFFWGRGFLLLASWSFAEVLGALAFIVSAIGVWWVCYISVFVVFVVVVDDLSIRLIYVCWLMLVLRKR